LIEEQGSSIENNFFKSKSTSTSSNSKALQILLVANYLIVSDTYTVSLVNCVHTAEYS
jgi:phage antirepressor YoqD-like protein